MSKNRNARAEPTTRSVIVGTGGGWSDFSPTGYTKLADTPEIRAGVNKIADLVSSMTIYLMENTESGDVRVRNELAKKLDVNPSKYMTRKSFISAIVRALLLEGDGNAVVMPITKNGLLDDLQFIPASRAVFVQNYPGDGYTISIDGARWDPDGLLHFVINPDPLYPWQGTGYKTTLKTVADGLRQAAETKKGFMESKWRPSLIVKVDALSSEFASKSGRAKILEEYVQTNEAGEPWMLPADTFDVKEVRPLSLTDIALPDSVRLDKRTAAAVLDIPAFVLGEGDFNADAWNNFVNTRLRTLANAIEQELTRKLVLSPYWYFKFNLRSLYAYDLDTLSNVGANMYTRGIMTGNEVRDWMNLSPKEGLDELIILENYIPAGMIGDQAKLSGNGGGDGTGA